MTLTVNRIAGKSTVFSVPAGQERVSGREAARHLQVGYADLVASRCHPDDRVINYGNERYAREALMAKVQAASNGTYVFTDDAYDYFPSATCAHDGWILESTGYLEEDSQPHS